MFMEKRKKLRFNLNHLKVSDDKGFTLLETMLALFIFILSLSLMTTMVQQFKIVRQQTMKTNHLEWHLFLNQFEHEVDQSLFLSTNGNSIYFEKYNDTKKIPEVISYQKMKGKEVIIRQVDDTGYQPVLMNIKTITFVLKENKVILNATFFNNEHYKSLVFINKKNQATLEDET